MKYLHIEECKNGFVLRSFEGDSVPVIVASDGRGTTLAEATQVLKLVLKWMLGNQRIYEVEIRE